MKIDVRGNNLIVFLNSRVSSKIDFFDKMGLEDYFRDLFLKFKDIYSIDVSGSYNIEVFIDKSYGVILNIQKDNMDFFDYYDDSIDMKITISRCGNFLYKLIGDVGSVIDSCDVYYFDGDIYIRPHGVNFLQMGYILENSLIIYGDESDFVVKKGKLLNVKKLV